MKRNKIKIEIPEDTRVEFSEDNGFAIMEFVPEEVKLEVGRWYQLGTAIYLVLDKELHRCGFKKGVWRDNGKCTYMQDNGKWKPADMKEVKRLLIQEAEKRGFKPGVNYYDGTYKYDCKTIHIREYGLYGHTAGCIFSFKTGQWTEIIREPLYIESETHEQFYIGDFAYWLWKGKGGLEFMYKLDLIEDHKSDLDSGNWVLFKHHHECRKFINDRHEQNINKLKKETD